MPKDCGSCGGGSPQCGAGSWQCGTNVCPVGTHPANYKVEPYCGNGPYKNATFCEPDCGYNFTVCGTLCPPGYRSTGTRYAAECDLGSGAGLYHNAATCVPN